MCRQARARDSRPAPSTRRLGRRRASFFAGAPSSRPRAHPHRCSTRAEGSTTPKCLRLHSAGPLPVARSRSRPRPRRCPVHARAPPVSTSGLRRSRASTAARVLSLDPVCRESALGEVPGSAGILPAAGRRPAIVQAGKMPALPGKAASRLGTPFMLRGGRPDHERLNPCLRPHRSPPFRPVSPPAPGSRMMHTPDTEAKDAEPTRDRVPTNRLQRLSPSHAVASDGHGGPVTGVAEHA